MCCGAERVTAVIPGGGNGDNTQLHCRKTERYDVAAANYDNSAVMFQCTCINTGVARALSFHKLRANCWWPMVILAVLMLSYTVVSRDRESFVCSGAAYYRSSTAVAVRWCYTV